MIFRSVEKFDGSVFFDAELQDLQFFTASIVGGEQKK